MSFFATRITNKQKKEAVEQRVNIVAVRHLTNSWLVYCIILQAHTLYMTNIAF